jgi:DNA-directed RNA polymerase specialized sigma24 family protein
VSYEVSDDSAEDPTVPGASSRPEAGTGELDLLALQTVLEAAGAEPEAARQRAGRLAVDAAVVRRLRAEGLAGRHYQDFTEKLLEYGWPILLGWTGSGEIFKRARAAGRPVPTEKITRDWTEDDRGEVVADTLTDGLRMFREQALAKGLWRPEGGATLPTYFVGATVRCFSRVYLRWFRDQENRRTQLRWPSAEPEEFLANIPDQRGVDPAEAAAARDQLMRIIPDLGPEASTCMVLRSMGYSQSEAAAWLGLSPKALEHRVSRGRVKIRTKITSEADMGERGTR